MSKQYEVWVTWLYEDLRKNSEGSYEMDYGEPTDDDIFADNDEEAIKKFKKENKKSYIDQYEGFALYEKTIVNGQVELRFVTEIVRKGKRNVR